MASSPDTETETKTLIPSLQNPTTNGHDSTVQSHQTIPPEPSQDPQNTNPDPSDSLPEKRKRVDPIEPSDTKESHDPWWKTSLCSFFRRFNGSCRHGDTCRYAHGEAELRPKPDNSWDPTSELANKVLKSENGEKFEWVGFSDTRDEGVMMTDALAGDGSESDPALVKCLVDLPMKWDAAKLRSFLSEQGIPYKSAKKKIGMSVGFVTFDNAEQVERATEKLDGRSVGNKNLKVSDAVPRKFEKTPDDSNSNSKSRSVRDVVTPLSYMPYVDQLEHKKNSLMKILKRLTGNARKACPNGGSLPEWILKAKEIGGLPCKLEGIVESPVVNGYRNKCEFTVGYSLDGKPTVGFALGNFREGVTAVEEPTDCPNVSRIACKCAAIFQEFLQHSGLPIWNRLNNTGFWRQLTVREGREPSKGAEVAISEVMLIVQVCLVGFDDGMVNCELEKMGQAFLVGASADSPSFPLTALVIQDHTGISNVAPADAPLHSLPLTRAESVSGPNIANDIVEPMIHDYISNLKFRISPTAFFQVNTLAAEKLYSLAGDWAGLGPDTLLFDICCGTGTIGLTLAHRVGMVVGIEMNASAVSDAIKNAEINGIKNCRFVCSKAERVMGSLLKEYLNLPRKQDEVPNVSETNDQEIISVEGNSTCDDHKDGASLELDNDKGASGCSETGNQEVKNQLPISCTSDNGTTSMQRYKNVVAIVDPPRAGLHPTVIKALRTHPRLRRIVYISCNPEILVANAIELCTPSFDQAEKGNKNNGGWKRMSSAGLARHRAKSMPNSEPFQPIKAMAVDIFPHTQHCELVMLLER